ncbi:hypothetical protein O181_010760 [Austropuccinia psidii MF-1]|uniref:Uncharacterized protein n=1 Tax=Austropuccinia psidii MF-1 TaxID=1389203 RepID=A0A9Q3BUJ1_9BASI|nr:hypothetical protein [Austropuccinia psidii MF-1]
MLNYGPLRALNMGPQFNWAQSARVDLPSNSGKAPLFYGPEMAMAIQAIWPIWQPGNPLKNGPRGLQLATHTMDHGLWTAAYGPWHAGHGP